MNLNKPSPEQQIILDHVAEGKHVVVNAVAGSGKSTGLVAAGAVAVYPILCVAGHAGVAGIKISQHSI